MIGIDRSEANIILDGLRAGLPVSPEIIDMALLATGDLKTTTAIKPAMIPLKNPIHIREARCAGRQHKTNLEICPKRDSCARHRQIELDRKLGIDTLPNIGMYTLPYVKGQECHFFLPA